MPVPARILILAAASPLLLHSEAPNAAPLYRQAFSLMRDAADPLLSASAVDAMLAGRTPYVDLTYRTLLRNNRRAVEALHRAAQLPACDWSLSNADSARAPENDIRQSLLLGRINILYSLHQLQAGARSDSLRTLAAGLRFSRHAGMGGPLAAALSAQALLQNHLRALAFVHHQNPLSADEKRRMLQELSSLPADPIDWNAALLREFALIGRAAPFPPALAQIYLETLENPGRLPQLRQALAAAPPSIAARVPNATRVIEQRAELRRYLDQARALLSP